MTTADVALPDEYGSTLQALKDRVQRARRSAQRTVNTQLIELYWTIGRDILVRQEQNGWGSRVIARLAGDLRAAFPDMTGFSPRNLQYMTAFARQWPGEPIAPQPVAQLPWGQIRTNLDKNLSAKARNWHAAAAVEYGWSRNMLMNMIMGQSMERTGVAPSNFSRQLALTPNSPSR